jgi:transposase InsO family protein
MRRAQIMPKAIRRFRVTTDSRNTKESPNLLNRVFKAARPNACWLTDITFIPTREGRLYLAAFLDDLYPPAVVGWAMSTNLDSKLAENALNMAISRRGLGPTIFTPTKAHPMQGPVSVHCLGGMPSIKARAARGIVGAMHQWIASSAR